MDLRVESVRVRVDGDPFVPTTSFVAPVGEVTLVVAPPGQAQTALALVLGGRLAHQGEVRLWGRSDPGYLQEHVALVDVENVSAPEGALPVERVIAEQLAFARTGSGRRATHAALDRLGLAEYSGQRWETVPAGLRTVALLDLAAQRPHVQAIVLGGPDRHGGEPATWLTAATRVASDVFTVVVLCNLATKELIDSGARA